MFGLKASWRTTSAGIGLLLVAAGSLLVALFDGDPATVPDIESLITAIAGLGFLASRDNKTSSASAGAK